MKSSLSLKFFLTVCLLFSILILTVILLNTTTLEYYYRYEKEKFLKNIYEQATIYNDNSIVSDTSDLIYELEKFDSTKNIEVLICDLDNNVIFASSSNFLKNGFLLPQLMGPGLSEFSLNSIASTLTEEKPFFIKSFKDNKMNSEFITLYGRLNDNYLIFLRTPLESIKESASVSNRFLIIVGIACLIISSIITYVVSKAFTKPIRELNEIAQSMAKLDFSKKYNFKTNDEIGTLGESINKLTESIETTINDLKNANIDLERDVEEKSKLSEMRNQFISDVSHELKTPIALIQGYAEGLADGIVQDEESKKYYVEVILDEANKMSNLTKDLLDLSRLEYGKEELQYQDFSLTELVKNTLKKNEIIFKDNGITAEFNDDKDVFVNADSNRIEQVLTNYISNAIKNASGEKKIICSIKDVAEDTVRVSVFNSGKNILDEDIPRLWTRFYKRDSSRNREAGGTGIGLSLVKAIMTQHHQKYGVNNADGGVEFWFELKKIKE